MPATLYLPDMRTSPTWRPSWEHATAIVLSAHVSHPAELWAIYSGERRDSPSQPSSGTSPVLSPSSTPALTQTLALKLVLGSQLGTGGGPGDFYQVGRLTAGTSVGQKPLAFGSLSSPSSQPPPEALTQKFWETTEELSKAGGKAEAETNPQTKFSSTSTLFQKHKISFSTHDMSPAKKTQPTALPGGNTTIAPSSSLPSPSPHHSDNTYVTLTRLSHQLSRTWYSREEPQHPSPGLTAHHS